MSKEYGGFSPAKYIKAAEGLDDLTNRDFTMTCRKDSISVTVIEITPEQQEFIEDTGCKVVHIINREKQND